MRHLMLIVAVMGCGGPVVETEKGSPEWFQDMLGTACAVEPARPRQGVTLDPDTVDLVYCVVNGDIARDNAGRPLCWSGCTRGRVMVWRGSALELKLEGSY